MSMHVHHPTGCSPTPLAHYLKALGILRLVAEQRDPQARGWWRDETFHLATGLDDGALRRFFLDEYRPTPIIAPWNGGTGFYPKDNKAGIDAHRLEHGRALRPLSPGHRVGANRDRWPDGESRGGGEIGPPPAVPSGVARTDPGLAGCGRGARRCR